MFVRFSISVSAPSPKSQRSQVGEVVWISYTTERLRFYLQITINTVPQYPGYSVTHTARGDWWVLNIWIKTSFQLGSTQFDEKTSDYPYNTWGWNISILSCNSRLYYLPGRRMLYLPSPAYYFFNIKSDLFWGFSLANMIISLMLT